MHEDVRVGDRLRAEAHETRTLLRDADEYLLIAGGIGITAIRPCSKC
ncbi:MAG: hypothetical protein WKH64_08835 [Chloroflexia bacterium]